MSSGVVVVYLIGLCACGPTTPPHREPPSCGHLALYTLLRLEGIAVGLDEVQYSLGTPSEGGHSLRQLQASSEAFGVRLIACRVADVSPTWDMIAYLEPPGSRPHFITLHPHNGKSFRVFDGWNPPYEVRDAVVSRIPGWTGIVLHRQEPSWSGRFLVAVNCVGGVCVLIVCRRSRS